MAERRFFLVRPEKLKAVAMDSFRCGRCQQWVYAEAYEYHLRHECADPAQLSEEQLNIDSA